MTPPRPLFPPAAPAAAGLFLFILAGCAEPDTAPTAADLAAARDAAAPAELAPAEVAPEPAERADAPAPPPADPALTAALEGLPPNLRGRFEGLPARWAARGTDPIAAAAAAVELQKAAALLMDFDEGRGYDAFRMAGEAAAEAGDRLGAGAGQIFYHAACALARDGETGAATAMLDRAAAAGWTRWDLAKSDPDLAAVRDADGFADRLAAWEAATPQSASAGGSPDGDDRNLARARHALETTEPFPLAFTYTDVEGEEHSLDDYAGQVVIVDYWGTWCPPCRAEIPSFVRLQEEYGERGLQILGLNYRDTPAKIKAFVEEYEMNYPTGPGPDEARDMVPNFRGYPTTVFVGRDGEVKAVTVGKHSYETLEAIVKQLLDGADAEPAGPPEPTKTPAELAREDLAAGEPFPLAFTFRDLDDKRQRLKDYAGKVVVVDYWGTWCPPCRAEVPTFVALQEKYGPEGLQILGLNYREKSVADVADFAEQHGINYPVGIGNRAAKDAVPDFRAYPTTVFVGRDGTVRLKVVGSRPAEYLETVIRDLLAEGTSAGRDASAVQSGASSATDEMSAEDRDVDSRETQTSTGRAFRSTNAHLRRALLLTKNTGYVGPRQLLEGHWPNRRKTKFAAMNVALALRDLGRKVERDGGPASETFPVLAGQIAAEVADAVPPAPGRDREPFAELFVRQAAALSQAGEIAEATAALERAAAFDFADWARVFREPEFDQVRQSQGFATKLREWAAAG